MHVVFVSSITERLTSYKINNPTILARIPHEELEALFVGYGWKPYFVEGSDFPTMHQAMAATLEQCIVDIRGYQKEARSSGKPFRPRWPMIVLRSPKGWSAPREVDRHFLEGFWRAHQIPLTDVATSKAHLDLLEKWMKSYKPEELFTADGALVEELRALPPTGESRMSANPVTNGGRKTVLDIPDFSKYGFDVQPGKTMKGSMANMAVWLRDVMAQNMTSMRVMGPDETESNKLSEIYKAGKKVWVNGYLPEDEDGGNLAMSGRVMEMLSEHTVEGWLEGYILSGRHGLLNSYEPFIHIIDSMVNQHCKWIEKCLEVEWRRKVPSLNILLTSTVWRQDHNGFTHQDPGFLDVITNKSPNVVRIYLPADGNSLLSVMNHCLQSENYVNVIVADKQDHLQFMGMEQALVYCTKGLGIWDWASTFPDEEPDVVMAGCGDVVTAEALAATSLLKEYLPELKIRFVNVVDLFKLISNDDHPHGLSDQEFDALFTVNKPVIFNFHSYPWLIHRLTYRRTGSHNIHVCGYREKGNIDTPLELAIRNGADRFTLAMEAIDRVQSITNKASLTRERLRDAQITARNYAFKNGIDMPIFRDWAWGQSQKLDATGGKSVIDRLSQLGISTEAKAASVIGSSE